MPSDAKIPAQLKKFGASIRRERITKGITQEKLAELADLNIRSVQKIEAGRINVLVTTDKNLSYQQNLSGRKIAIVVLGQGRWSLIKAHVSDVVSAVTVAAPGSYTLVEIPFAD